LEKTILCHNIANYYKTLFSKIKNHNLMKKVLFFLFSLTLLQSSFAQRIGIGLRLNGHFATQAFPSSVQSSLDLLGGLKNQTNISFTIPLEIKLSDLLSVQPELMYLQKGTKISSNLFGVATIEASQKVNYLEVPILIKLNFLTNAPLGVNFLVGPSFGYALSGINVSSISGTGIPASTQTNEDLTDYARFELGAHAGINLGLKVGSGRIILDSRYLFGISKLNKSPVSVTTTIPGTTPPTTNTTNEGIYNRGFSIGLGYMHYF
jgi:Outer membrane protein beta-barrel domain